MLYELTRAETPELLLRHFERHDGTDLMDQRAVSAIWNRLSKQRANARSLDREAMRRLRSRTLALVPEMDHWSMCNVTNALARLSLRDAPLFAALGDKAAGDAGTLEKQNFANMLYSFGLAASMGIEHPAACRAMLEQAVATRDELEPAYISNVIYACGLLAGTSEPPDPLAARAMGDAATERANSFDEQGFSNVMYGFALMGLRHTPSFGALADALLDPRGPRLESQQACSNIAWAHALLDTPNPRLFDLIGDTVARQLDQCSAQTLSTVGWAFAVHDHRHALFAPTSPYWNAVARLTHWREEGLTQLHQTLLWSKEKGEAPRVPDAFRARCRAVFGAVPTRISEMEQRVASLLALVPGLEVAMDRRTADEGFSIDVTVGFEGHELLLEFDGPDHFVFGDYAPLGSRTPLPPNGRTLLKRRQLHSFGHRLVSVPFYDTNGLGDGELLRYLQRRLLGGPEETEAAAAAATTTATTTTAAAAAPTSTSCSSSYSSSTTTITSSSDTTSTTGDTGTTPDDTTSGGDDEAADGRVAVFMAGLPGSGKTRTIREHFLSGGKQGDEERGVVVLDLDVEMKHHPEYDPAEPSAVYARPDAYAWADARVQRRFDESLADASLRTIVLDGTGTKVERRLRRAAQAKAAGWVTRLLVVRVSLETAIERNAKRSRQVPRAVLEQYEEELSRAVSAVMPAMDEVVVVDNDPHDGLTGRARWQDCYDRYDRELSGSVHLCERGGKM